MADPIVIGIAGGTNSGKTTMVKRIADEFGEQIAMLSHDFYYLRRDNEPFEQRCQVNYDHPDAFETDLMIQHVKALKAGQSIERPCYDYAIHNRTSEVVKVNPSKVIIIEGILIFENKELRDLCDVKLFIDAPADIRILRRIKRDVAKRGRTVESVINQYLTTVRPMHELFVEPSKQYADIIIPEGGRNIVAFEMISQKIKSLLEENNG